MKITKWLAFVGFAVASLCVPHLGRAQEARDCSVLNRATVVRCAVNASLAAKAETQTLESLAGRRRAAGVLLPSNPVLTVTGGRDMEPAVTANEREPLWSATLSQELEIAGQRGRRLDVVAAEHTAQSARIIATRRDAAADALTAYFDALAALEEAKLAQRVARLASALTVVAHARAQAGVSADVEAQLAEASAAQLLQRQLAAQMHITSTTATLATAVGLDPSRATPRVEGELVPIEVAGSNAPASVDAAVERRAEIQVARAEVHALERRVELYERSRIPNPTLSIFARNDWINERLVGVGVSIPIPLPAPVGRTYAGEIAETTALAARATTDVERLRRSIRLEITNALQVVALRRRQLDLFQEERVRTTEETLRSIAEEIEARRLPVRDALLTQQLLIDYLFAYVEARRQLCLASVELARAAGVALEGGAP